MRLTLVVAGIGIIVSIPVTASSAELLRCWHESRTDSETFEPISVTVCVVEGSRAEFVLERGTAVDFSPNVGYEQSGIQCWFWTTATTEWVIISTAGDTATLGFDPDPAAGPIAINVTLPVCTSRPEPVLSDSAAVWSLIEEYVHQEPDPTVDPPVGLGLTGLDTFVALTPPDPFDATLTSPGTGVTLEVHAEVSAVTVEWGDGSDADSFTGALYPLLTPSPDGAASHIYEIKTCSEPGASRCHATLSAYPLTVSYEWTARWRPGASEWRVLSVPDTFTTIDYPVDEVISVLTGSG
ncbi:MAG: hypothetical protein ACE5MI_05130 [Acidimicrobiia bacterium]